MHQRLGTPVRSRPRATTCGMSLIASMSISGRSPLDAVCADYGFRGRRRGMSTIGLRIRGRSRFRSSMILIAASITSSIVAAALGEMAVCGARFAGSEPSCCWCWRKCSCCSPRVRWWGWSWPTSGSCLRSRDRGQFNGSPLHDRVGRFCGGLRVDCGVAAGVGTVAACGWRMR